MRLACGHPLVSHPAPHLPFPEHDQSDNFPEPGKRPLSSITPAILEYANGSFYLAIGGAGGSKIPTATLQALLNVEWGMDASEAVERGRVHHQLYADHVDADDILPAGIINDLRGRGHNVTGAFDADADIPRPCPRCIFPLTYCV